MSTVGTQRGVEEHEMCDSIRWSHGENISWANVQRDRPSVSVVAHVTGLHVARIHPFAFGGVPNPSHCETSEWRWFGTIVEFESNGRTIWL